jgi:N-acetylmuramoyl-L-alanine amidase
VQWIAPGQVGPEVEDVQRRLADLGLPCDDDPGVFGEATRASVRAFQQQRGLAADGVVGDDTWHALVGAGFRLGDRLLYLTQPPVHGDDVREIQQRLNRLGFECGYDDGVYGERTASAIRDFQLNVGMTVDGIAGPQTFDLLGRLHRHHQEAPLYVVREREALRRERRPSLAGARIMIDPAHGVDRPGVTGVDDAREHEVAWQIATLVDGRLRALGASVVLSRGPRSSPSPSERASYANAEDVEVILSIHVNGDRSASARGVAAYHFGTDAYVSEHGRALAEMLVEHLVGATGAPDCRVHPATSALLRESRAPAVIVEVGFLTHPVEGRLLASPLGQRIVAGALVDALVTFLLAPVATR